MLVTLGSGLGVLPYSGVPFDPAGSSHSCVNHFCRENPIERLQQMNLRPYTALTG